MIDRAAIGWLERGDDTFHASEKLVVTIGGLLALPVPLRQLPKFHPENARLDGVESPIVALEVMPVLLCLAVIAQHANFSRKQFIASCNRPSLPKGPKVLSRIKTKSGRAA